MSSERAFISEWIQIDRDIRVLDQCSYGLGCCLPHTLYLLLGGRAAASTPLGVSTTFLS